MTTTTQNPFRIATLAEMQDALSAKLTAAKRKTIVAQCVEVLEARVAKAKPGSYKARRSEAAIAQLKASGSLDAKGAFESAKATPKASKAKGKRKATTTTPKALTKKQVAGLEALGLDETQLAGAMALLGS
jgi:hypothetical protein